MLYKFAGQDGITAIISNRTLKFATLESFNDPFEFHSGLIEKSVTLEHWLKIHISRFGRELTEEEIKVFTDIWTNNKHKIAETINKVLKIRYDDTRMCCFSYNKNNLLMWGYYTENHKGACLMFDKEKLISKFIGDCLVGDVKYQDVIAPKSISDEGLVALDDLCLTKSKDWAHEDEFRIVIGSNPEEFQEYPPDALIGVVFGDKSTKEFKTKIKEILKNKKWTWVKTYEMKISDTKFELEEVQL